MPKAKKRRKIEITLILSEEEAKWLKCVMQNPFTHEMMDYDEEESNRSMRHSFFNVLREELGNV